LKLGVLQQQLMEDLLSLGDFNMGLDIEPEEHKTAFSLEKHGLVSLFDRGPFTRDPRCIYITPKGLDYMDNPEEYEDETDKIYCPYCTIPQKHIDLLLVFRNPEPYFCANCGWKFMCWSEEDGEGIVTLHSSVHDEFVEELLG
jgi:hypothetical protein